MYEARKNEFLTLVVGVSTMLDRVAIVPASAGTSDLWQRLAVNGVVGLNIEFFKVSRSTLSDLQPIPIPAPRASSLNRWPHASW
jgi:hypothetical protein